MTSIEQHAHDILTASTISSFAYIEGGELYLYFEESPTEKSKDSRWLLISSAWRIRDGEKVLSGSLDDEALQKKTLPSLIGRSINRVSFGYSPGDLQLELDTGLQLESFVHNVEYDCWELAADDQTAIGVSRGGVEYSREREKLSENERAKIRQDVMAYISKREKSQRDA